MESSPIPALPSAQEAPTPSAGLLSAALAGLLATSMIGCGGDDADRPDWADPGAVPSLDAGTVNPAPVANADAGAPDAGPTGPITLSEVEGNRTFASLRAECDTRGGYMQVHASCSGSNDCKGFSYGNWEPGVLSEHTCAAANGCNGASCVVLPPDSGKTGKQLYELEELPAGGPSSCTTCHAEWHKDAAGNYLPPDATKFKLFLPPGSTRNAQNWLTISAQEQENIIAFGLIGRMPDGTVQRSMKGYHKLFSRAEIQRVVQHLRTLTPVVTEIKNNTW